MKKWILLAVALLAAGIAQAGLVLNVDMAADELWFTGSDAGSASAGMFGASLNYQTPGLGSAGAGEFTDLDIYSCFDIQNDTGSFMRAFFPVIGTHGLDINLYSSDDIGTVTGNGTHVSYATVDYKDSLALRIFLW